MLIYVFILITIRLLSFFTIDTATYIHSSTFGYGDKQIIGDTWLVQVDETVNYATVSRDGLCVPLIVHSYLQKPCK